MHRIIALWCVPRSRSTAMERVFYEFKDFKILHEPFLYLYYLFEKRRALPHFDPDPGHPRSFEAIRDWIRGAADTQPVLFKDMSYYVVDHLARERAFFLELTNTFLIRDPAETVLSYWKVDPDLTLPEIGHESLYRHAMFLADASGERPIVVDAGDLVANPRGTLMAYCQAIGVPFKPEALAWDTKDPGEWQSVEAWHQDVKATRGIVQTNDPAPDALAHLRENPKLRAYEAHHRKFYEKLLEYRLRPIEPCLSG
jgi:hypothetical protein